MPYVILETPEAPLAVVRLNRPDSANALNMALAQELAAIFQNLKQYRVVILTGQGKHFSAGADLKERRGMSGAAWEKQHRAFRAARDAILHCPLPVIAAVHGAAFAGGLELAMACDFIYAASDARFALTEATLGIMPGLGGTQLLPRAIGMRRAKEILFSGKPFTAEQAYAWGLVNTLCPPETLMEETIACARGIAASAPLSVKEIKQAVREGMELPLTKALTAELKHYRKLLKTKDRHEGIAAFNEKRKPAFTGE